MKAKMGKWRYECANSGAELYKFVPAQGLPSECSATKTITLVWGKLQARNRPPRPPPNAYCLISYWTLPNIYRESTVLLRYCYGIGPCGSMPQYCLIL